MTLSIMALSITTFRITINETRPLALCIMIVNTECLSCHAKCRYAECFHAECSGAYFKAPEIPTNTRRGAKMLANENTRILFL
jgi:hypothetical protein